MYIKLRTFKNNKIPNNLKDYLFKNINNFILNETKEIDNKYSYVLKINEKELIHLMDFCSKHYFNIEFVFIDNL